MNDAESFIIDLLGEVLTKSDSNTDLLNLLKNGQGRIESSQERIEGKIDTIIEQMQTLLSSFQELKLDVRNIDEKFKLMDLKLDRLARNIDVAELEDYYALSQGLYNYWDELDELTRKFIPVSEYLFSKLQKLKDPDYSPVIIELCRAIENEFLLKIFRKYTLDIISRKGRSLDTFLCKDKTDMVLSKKMSIFVKVINTASRTHNPEYTLGQMNTILSLLNQNNIVALSPLLQDFKEYLLRETKVEELLNIRYMTSINDLVRDYRNPSAHPEFMELQKAKDCKEIMPERLDYLMGCISI
jgi:hypothetical protein